MYPLVSLKWSRPAGEVGDTGRPCQDADGAAWYTWYTPLGAALFTSNETAGTAYTKCKNKQVIQYV